MGEKERLIMAEKYSKRFVLGIAPSGKQVRKRVYGSTKRKLEVNIYAAKKQFEYAPHGIDKLFGDYSAQWLETYKSNRAAATIKDYRDSLRHCTILNPLRMSEITKTDCQRVINDCSDHPRTCEKLSLTLKQVFNAAIEDDIIVKNPASKLELPNYSSEDKRCLTEEEINVLSKLELPEMHTLFIDVMFYMGLRPGEARALRIESFDFKKKVAKIDHATNFINNQPIYKDTKTHRNREVPIPDDLIPKLEKYIETLKTPWLFHQRSGNLLTATSYRRMKERIFKEMNKKMGGDENHYLLGDLTFYTFRHTYCTFLYYNGCKTGLISTKAAAKICGHSEKVFLSTYAHLDDEKEETFAVINMIKK